MSNQETGKQTQTLGERFIYALAEEPGRIIENAGNLYSFHDPHGSLNDLAEKIQEGATPVILPNHQGLSDGPALAVHIAQKLNLLLGESVFGGFNVLASSSLSSGDQVNEFDAIYDYLAPAFAKMRFYLIDVIRQKDRSVYGIEGSNDEARDFFFNSAKLKRGIVVFPEGTVKGGRAREDGEIYGMQPFEKDGWHQLFVKIKTELRYCLLDFTEDTRS